MTSGNVLKIMSQSEFSFELQSGFRGWIYPIFYQNTKIRPGLRQRCILRTMETAKPGGKEAWSWTSEESSSSQSHSQDITPSMHWSFLSQPSGQAAQSGQVRTEALVSGSTRPECAACPSSRTTHYPTCASAHACGHTPLKQTRRTERDMIN